jgi:hypothetical protein
LAGLGVNLAEVVDSGEEYADRVAAVDVAWFAARVGLGQGEENTVADGQRHAGPDRHDRAMAKALFDVLNPSFVGGKAVQGARLTGWR